MKILTLDVGNTTIDACIFEEDKINHLGRFPHKDVIKLKGDWNKIALVSVKPSMNDVLKDMFGDSLKLITLKDIPIEVDYRTLETLGTDRVLFAYGVREFYSRDAVLVSAGTALVVDLLLDGVFQGGFITGGLSLKLKALSERAEGIPYYEPKALDLSVGKSTEECVIGGVFKESFAFIERTAKRWSEACGKKLPVIIAGGDGKLFERLGIYDPLILHKAMYRIIING